jgi:hypothetical protein
MTGNNDLKLELESTPLSSDGERHSVYDREKALKGQLNRFLADSLALPDSDYAAALDLAGLLALKSALSGINNLITLKLTLGLADWIAGRYELAEEIREDMRKYVLATKPNANGYDFFYGYPRGFVGEVKCNVPISGGTKYGANQRDGIIADVESLMKGKPKGRILTDSALKFMAFLDRPEVRAANAHLLKTNPNLRLRLSFFESDIAPTDTNLVHGVYIRI